MQEMVEIQYEVEISDEGHNDLENQIEIMKSDLMKAQSSLSRLEQFETEKLRLKEDLELKIEEFNMLTDHYQNEKEAYLQVLEQIQGQVNIYKEKSQKFDAEKGSWSKQIDELKAELTQTKATLVKMEELEQRNAQLAADLQAKDVEIYRLKKEHERTLNQQLEQFKQEMKLYQDKITQYEKDREIWEKQMKQMKSQFAGLEASLEERENFIKQFIKQPPTQSAVVQPVSSEQFFRPKPEDSGQKQQPVVQPSQQNGDWMGRMMSAQPGGFQTVAQNIKTASSTTMDFFTLRNKTTQPAVQGAVYGSQWSQEF
ncbi:hypothetical protein [Bacillus rubiinfantis]|uniref:hypothetical protein n=1 Tax=Bacillus rubiinfantis TaxID=1499680 RepID=UPI0005A9B78A|nr:hypothetical protein [Bacillus rubiinfantis]